MKEVGLVGLLFTLHRWPGVCMPLTWEQLAPGFTMGRRHAGRGSVMLLANLGPVPGVNGKWTGSYMHYST